MYDQETTCNMSVHTYSDMYRLTPCMRVYRVISQGIKYPELFLHQSPQIMCMVQASSEVMFWIIIHMLSRPMLGYQRSSRTEWAGRAVYLPQPSSKHTKSMQHRHPLLQSDTRLLSPSLRTLSGSLSAKWSTTWVGSSRLVFFRA